VFFSYVTVHFPPDILNPYSNDSDFELQLRHLAALAFVSPEDVIETFELLMESEFFITNEALLIELISYFEKTWLD
jgi:hypothetical protein